jgi:hypothetical protein
MYEHYFPKSNTWGIYLKKVCVYSTLYWHKALSITPVTLAKT